MRVVLYVEQKVVATINKPLVFDELVFTHTTTTTTTHTHTHTYNNDAETILTREHVKLHC
jgi:hypothetical protein